MKGFSPQEERAYRALQKHLDRQPVGFPATRTGADLRFLRRMFTPEEARLALHLSYRPSALSAVMETAGTEFSEEKVGELLESLLMKGSIGFKEVDGEGRWLLHPLVIGMYEAQDGRPTRSFLKDAGAYMRTFAFGKSLLSASPSQMRTIPINASIPVDHPVATYDQVTSIIENSPGPFVILPCICRESSSLQGKSCQVTEREETCMGMGSMASMILHRGGGREIDRTEALEILRQNQEEGLVLQPSNAKDPEFICSCCGCCCGMLQMQKMLPHPVDFWTCSFRAEVETGKCTGCGICVKRCQVGAVTLKGSPERAVIAATRCIGCGLCVPTCPSKALSLVPREEDKVPPEDTEDLYETIMKNRKGRLGELPMLLKVFLKMRQ
jgi:electron transport complex protein RnfB